MDHSSLDDEYDFGPSFTEIIRQQNNQCSTLDDAPLSPPPRAEADPVEALPTHERKSNEDWDIGDYLDESFEGLELNGYAGLSSIKMSDSTFGRTKDIDMDAGPALFLPKAINTLLMPELTNKCSCGFYPLFFFLSIKFLTRSQIKRTALLLLLKLPTTPNHLHSGHSRIIGLKGAPPIYGPLPTIPACYLLPPTANTLTVRGLQFPQRLLQTIMICGQRLMTTLHPSKATTIHKPASGPRAIRTGEVRRTRQR